MKLNIENKILIPFVALFLISQIVTLATSFRNDYNLIIRNQYRNMDAAVQQLERGLNYDFKNGNLNTQDRGEIIRQIENTMDDKIIVEWNGKVLLNKADYKLEITSLKEMGMNGKIAHLQNDDYLFSYYYYAPLGWSMTIMDDKRALLSIFYESYKYNILTAIIFLTLSLQITVFVSSNITNPIKKLVRFCSSIRTGTGNRIDLKRRDEIGQLNEAFNQMWDQLDTSMEELIRVKNYNQNILNSIEKGIMTFDKNGQKISSNPYAVALLETFDGYYCEGQSVEAISQALIEKMPTSDAGLYEQIEFVKEESNDRYYLDYYVSVMHDDKKGIQGYICSFNDVTQRKKFEHHMQRLDRLATAGRLASGVAHEIRNPLTGMRTSMQLLKKRLEVTQEDKNGEIINRTIKEIDRINRLISDLLGYSRPKTHEPEPIDVAKGIQSVLLLLEGDLAKKGIKVNQQYEEMPLIFFMDPNHFHQVLLNIIKNAIDAVAVEGMITIYGKHLDDDQRGELKVIDNGIGLLQADLEKVFDPFFTLKHEGTGLGLSVVHELVHQNDGTVMLESRVGKGTTVTFNFRLGGRHNE